MQPTQNIKGQCEQFLKKLKKINMFHQCREDYINVVISNVKNIQQYQKKYNLSNRNIDSYQKNAYQLNHQLLQYNRENNQPIQYKQQLNQFSNQADFQPSYHYPISTNQNFRLDPIDTKSYQNVQNYNNNQQLYALNQYEKFDDDYKNKLIDKNDQQISYKTQQQENYQKQLLIAQSFPTATNINQYQIEQNPQYIPQTENMKYNNKEQNIFQKSENPYQKQHVKTQSAQYDQIQQRQTNNQTLRYSNSMNNNIDECQQNIEKYSSDKEITYQKEKSKTDSKYNRKKQSIHSEKKTDDFLLKESTQQKWDDQEIIILTYVLSKAEINTQKWKDSFLEMTAKYNKIAQERNLPTKTFEQIVTKIKGDIPIVSKNEKRKFSKTYKGLYDKSINNFI